MKIITIKCIPNTDCNLLTHIPISILIYCIALISFHHYTYNHINGATLKKGIPVPLTFCSKCTVFAVPPTNFNRIEPVAKSHTDSILTHAGLGLLQRQGVKSHDCGSRRPFYPLCDHHRIVDVHLPKISTSQ